MSFFGGYSKREKQLEEQDKKFLEFQRQIREEEVIFEKGDYLAMVLGAFWALWPALAITLAVIVGVSLFFL
mgnify:CR=1 FL=1